MLGGLLPPKPMSAARRSNIFWLVLVLIAGIAAYRLRLAACVLVSGLLAAFFMGSHIVLARADRRASRLARGLCPACGYDLRSTPHRCPECGHVSPRGVRIAFEDWLAAEFRELGDARHVKPTERQPDAQLPKETGDSDQNSSCQSRRAVGPHRPPNPPDRPPFT